MWTALRPLMRRLLGVVRTPTYYLPWLTYPGLECALVLSNVESRFSPEFNQGPFPVAVTQYDADGRIARRYAVSLADCVEAVELGLEPAPGGCGFAMVAGERLQSDFYVTLTDGRTYTATHGRGEFIETYPLRARLPLAAIGRLLALFGRTLPAFVRDQYAYVGPDHQSNLLLMNLSNIPNRVRVAASGVGRLLGARLITLPPMGSHLLDVRSLSMEAARSTDVWRLRLEGNAWFNLYIVGAGARGLAGSLSLMHVK
jgi:hypothetical protein